MIIVCPLSAVQRLVDDHRVGQVVSLLGPETPHRDFTGIVADRHLKLTFHDIVEPVEGFTAPRAEDAETLVSFLRGWDRADPLLIHCWAGISRSTAAAFTALVHAEARTWRKSASPRNCGGPRPRPRPTA